MITQAVYKNQESFLKSSNQSKFGFTGVPMQACVKEKKFKTSLIRLTLL